MENTAPKNGGARLSVGGSSILVIFVILTLTTFATLSLVSAVSDRDRSAKSQAAFNEYYAADAAAEDLLKELDEALATARTSAAYINQAQTALGKLPWVTVARAGDGLVAQYAVLVSEVPQLLIELQVELYISPNPAAAIERRQWRTVTTVKEDEEAALNLWSDENAPPLLGDLGDEKLPLLLAE